MFEFITPEWDLDGLSTIYNPHIHQPHSISLHLSTPLQYLSTEGQEPVEEPGARGDKFNLVNLFTSEGDFPVENQTCDYFSIADKISMTRTSKSLHRRQLHRMW